MSTMRSLARGVAHSKMELRDILHVNKKKSSNGTRSHIKHTSAFSENWRDYVFLDCSHDYYRKKRKDLEKLQAKMQQTAGVRG